MAPRHAASRQADRHYGQSRNKSIQPSVTLQGGVKATNPHLTKVIGIGSYRSIYHPYFRGETMHVRYPLISHAHPSAYTNGSQRYCLIAEKPSAITRHDNTKPHACYGREFYIYKYIDQRRANYNTEKLFVEQLSRIITTSTDEPMK